MQHGGGVEVAVGEQQQKGQLPGGEGLGGHGAGGLDECQQGRWGKVCEELEGQSGNGRRAAERR